MDPKPQGVWFRLGFIHQKMVIITYLMLAVAAVVIFPSAAYVNISLSSPYMSAKVFMPMESEGFSNDRFYIGSRFEHGSMIGDFLIGNDREVYGRGLWREPHNPNWPESGVGLASEFGCGHDGVACVGRGDIYNGVLGYDTAKAGEPFLKIGVGALIKGSCPACSWKDDDVYKFNSPYKFFRPPSWKVLSSPGPNEVTIYSEEKLGEFRIRHYKNDSTRWQCLDCEKSPNKSRQEAVCDTLVLPSFLHGRSRTNRPWLRVKPWTK